MVEMDDGLINLCDTKVSLKLNGKFYRTTTRPMMLYGTKCWIVKNQHKNKIHVVKMRMCICVKKLDEIKL